MCEMLGLEILDRPTIGRPTVTPPWKKRLEQKISNMRRKIGVIYIYLGTTTPSKRVLRSVRKVASEFKIKRRDPNFKDQISFKCDVLKQKIKALGSRMRRYNERVKRYKNNQLYAKDQKRFFREIEGKGSTLGNKQLNPIEAHRYWTQVWGGHVSYDEDAYWIEDVAASLGGSQMREVEISTEDIAGALKNSRNWASPGVDKLQNYWWKNFTSTHNSLAGLFQQSLDDPSMIPEYLTLGGTYLVLKGGESTNPENYRPITCLSSIYKLLTAVLTGKISEHLKRSNMMAREQGGCRKRSKACKELLIIDHILTKQAKRKLRNISIAWIDYRKAFDSVPHAWLLKVLEMHGITAQVVNFLRYLMKNWRTSILLQMEDGIRNCGLVNIYRGIFQGDTFSPVWFCLALNPLSCLLNESGYGYVIDKQRNVRVNHQLYIDDLKLFAANKDQLKRLLELVASFTDSINMQMGVDKCATLEVKRGKIQETEEKTILMNAVAIPGLDLHQTYKYLGIRQALDIRMAEMKESFKSKLYNRVNTLLKSKLNSKFLFNAINAWAIPSMTFSFGVLTWSDTDLREIDKTIRTMMTKYGMHHPHSSVIRLYLPRQQGGRGLLNLERTHSDVINKLREYFLAQHSPFFRAIREADQNISALKLSEPGNRIVSPTHELIEQWRSKALHGRYPGHQVTFFRRQKRD